MFDDGRVIRRHWASKINHIGTSKCNRAAVAAINDGTAGNFSLTERIVFDSGAVSGFLAGWMRWMVRFDGIGVVRAPRW
jgi:hypothetical protein